MRKLLIIPGLLFGLAFGGGGYLVFAETALPMWQNWQRMQDWRPASARLLSFSAADNDTRASYLYDYAGASFQGNGVGVSEVAWKRALILWRRREPRSARRTRREQGTTRVVPSFIVQTFFGKDLTDPANFGIEWLVNSHSSCSSCPSWLAHFCAQNQARRPSRSVVYL